MAIDNDLSALLPEPPPPRPARREVAIEEALRRFDGLGDEALARPASARPAPVRKGWGRPQIAALASAALVLLVSVPIWWAEEDRFASDAPQAPPPAAPNPPSGAPAPKLRPPQQAAPPGAPPAAASASPPDSSIADAKSLPQALDEVPPNRVSAPAPPVARPAASAEVSDRAIVVTGSRVARRNFESSSPITTVSTEVLDAQGDWNACTLLDPRRDLSACRAFADPSARGATGRAAAQLEDGLALAWQGELDRAIDSFDRAIRANPDLPVAYLNRGLAYQSNGNLRRALADLNRAVSKDQDNARGYYHRSRLHRARGDTERADADADRAIELDPGYHAVLP
jgi:hypothetical protein